MAGGSHWLLASSQRRGFTTNDCRRRQQVKMHGAIFAEPLHTFSQHHCSTYVSNLLTFCRASFLSFCNHSESRCIFVHVVRADREGGEIIQVSSSPPSSLDNKAMVILKCSHASKLSKENLAQDVIYTGNSI